MKTVNCSLDECRNIIGEKDIILFGCGGWVNFVYGTKLMDLSSNFKYIIDNNPRGQIKIGNVELNVYNPSKLKEQKECVVILISPVYMYEMYMQLMEMNLPDTIYCMAFPFMQYITPNCTKDVQKGLISGIKKQQIKKKIHSFWFSGDSKPYEYQKCLDTWPAVLSEYEIIEWNKDNYDWHKHPFLERAVGLEAWAFATDYARLDIIYEQGGIYLDMDIEMIKEFDDLLWNSAFFGFSNHVAIDLAVFGAKEGHPIIRKLLDLYDDVELPKKREEFTRFFQPGFVRNALIENGIIMNGSFQWIDDVVIFPPEFFYPEDHILFKPHIISSDTRCIHHDNFGWSFSNENKKKKKMRDNQKLWNLFDNNSCEKLS